MDENTNPKSYFCYYSKELQYCVESHGQVSDSLFLLTGIDIKFKNYYQMLLILLSRVKWGAGKGNPLKLHRECCSLS